MNHVMVQPVHHRMVQPVHHVMVQPMHHRTHLTPPKET
jgi:hypothetical protein